MNRKSPCLRLHAYALQLYKIDNIADFGRGSWQVNPKMTVVRSENPTIVHQYITELNIVCFPLNTFVINITTEMANKIILNEYK